MKSKIRLQYKDKETGRWHPIDNILPQTLKAAKKTKASLAKLDIGEIRIVVTHS